MKAMINKTQFKNPNYQSGLTLLEVMISLTLGLFMLQGLVSLLVSTKAMYNREEDLTEIYDTGNAALSILIQDLNRVGFLGSGVAPDRITAAADLDVLINGCEDNADAFEFSRPLWGTEALTSNVVGCIDDAQVSSAKPSDVLALKFVGRASVTDIDGDQDIDVDDGLKESETYLMVNDEKGIAFDDEDSAPTITEGGDVPLGNAWPYRSYVYYIGTDDENRPSLKRKSLQQATMKEEVVSSGVEAMRILYGEDKDNDLQANTFSPADKVEDWNNVIAIKVFMLVRSEEACEYVDEKVYQLGDVQIPAQADYYRRAVVQASVSLRNIEMLKKVSK